MTRDILQHHDGIANKTQNFEAVAQYQFDFGLRPSLAWVYSKGIDLGGNDYHPGNGYDYVDQDLVNYIDVGMTYMIRLEINDRE